MYTLLATRGDDAAERTVSLEKFGFVRCSATTSSTVTPLDSDDHHVMNSEKPAAPLSKRRGLNSDWVEGHRRDACGLNMSMMFHKWCHCFDKNEHRNQFVKGHS